jgi:hypothetical protein
MNILSFIRKGMENDSIMMKNCISYKKKIKINFHFERRKKEARKPHVLAKKAKLLRGIKAKQFNKNRYKEKVEMRKMFSENFFTKILHILFKDQSS